MGQGGHIVLVNATPYAWHLASHLLESMEWEFPRDASVVESYTSKRVYVESRASASRAAATYRLDGRHETFTIQARSISLQVSMDNFGTMNAAQGSVVQLGLISNRPSYFVLSGEGGDYHSVGNARDWMSQNLSTLGSRKLRDICVPSSHDSGMSRVPWSTAFAAVGSVATQYVSVEEQLKFGVRYFDIRPVQHRGQWACGHYSFINAPSKWHFFPPFDTWQGGDGESLQDIIDGINRYTLESHELIVLNISEARVIKDVSGNFRRDDFVDLDAAHWNLLLDKMTNSETGIQCLWKPETGPPPAQDLTNLTLHNLIGCGSSAVLVLVHNGVDVSGRPGVFHYSNWPFDASAWDKPEAERMKEFQQHMLTENPRSFTFSGCHTQSDTEAVLTTLGQSSSFVLSLATPSKDRLFTELFDWCTREGKYPSSLVLDGIDSSDLAALCMAFNDAHKARFR
ncbi:hypothetical protein J3458_015527 [Metarhizium acridum]|nr:hypothetical protein J3458_015527 [Metarhizium acridum]